MSITVVDDRTRAATLLLRDTDFCTAFETEGRIWLPVDCKDEGVLAVSWGHGTQKTFVFPLDTYVVPIGAVTILVAD